MHPFVLLLAACNGTVNISDDSSAGGDDSADTYEYSGPEPVIFDGEAACTGSDTWDFTLTVGDQQGADTVTGGTYIVFANGDGSVWGEGEFECKGGKCVGTAQGGFCAQAEEFKLHFVVEDADGNKSRALEILGKN